MENMGLIVMKGSDIERANIIKERVGDNLMTGYILALGNQLRERMQHGVVEFYYHKKSGEIRRAFGTTMPAIVKAHTINGGSSIKVITYWDCEKAEFRACQLHSLIKIC